MRVALDRGHLLDARASVTLTWVVAILSLITGIANIGQPYLVGPFEAFIPTPIQRTAGFTGTLTGFLMILTALGMRRRLHVAWRATVVLLPLTAVQGLVQSSPWSLPLVVVSLVAIPHVLSNRGRFDRPVELTTAQIAAIAALVGAQAYGTVGAYVLRDEFDGVDSLVDALYFTVVTSSTVGYGDIVAQTEMARLFGLTVILVGMGSFAFALGTVLGPLFQARIVATFERMTEQQLESLSDHVIVLGYGELTEPILTELGGTTVVVITLDGERAATLSDRGYHVLHGDPADEETLNRVDLNSARAIVVATADDGDDALAILTVREHAPSIRIVAAATDRENVEKLRRAGADSVISPATIGGRILARSALGDDASESRLNELLNERP